MAVATEVRTAKRVSGGSFLIEDLTPEDIFTLEDISPEQKQIADVAAKFAEEKIAPQVGEIEAKHFDVSRKLMRELGDLGLLGIDVPEEYGGMDLDKVTASLVSQNLSACGSFSVTSSAHVNIGILPLVWFGTPEQKEKYLPQAGERRMDRRLCVVRGLRGLGCDEHRRARDTRAGWQALSPQWRKDVDFQCRHRQLLYYLRQDRRGEVLRFPGRGGDTRASPSARRSISSAFAVLPPARWFLPTARCRSRICWARPARAIRSPSTF